MRPQEEMGASAPKSINIGIVPHDSLNQVHQQTKRTIPLKTGTPTQQDTALARHIPGTR